MVETLEGLTGLRRCAPVEMFTLGLAPARGHRFT